MVDIYVTFKCLLNSFLTLEFAEIVLYFIFTLLSLIPFVLFCILLWYLIKWIKSKSEWNHLSLFPKDRRFNPAPTPLSWLSIGKVTGLTNLIFYMTYAIGNLKIFHDLIEIHEYLSSLPVILLYQYQGMLITINSIPVLRVLILHDIDGISSLSYSRISRTQVETFYL